MNCGELTSSKFIGHIFLREEKGTLIIGSILLFILTQSPNLAVPHKVNVTRIGKHQQKPALQQFWQSQVTHTFHELPSHQETYYLSKLCQYFNQAESANTNILESGQRELLSQERQVQIIIQHKKAWPRGTHPYSRRGLCESLLRFS